MKGQAFLTEDEMYELLSFLVSSAQLCVSEPKMYGPFRLIDGASRMLGFVLENGEGDDEFLSEFKATPDNSDSGRGILRLAEELFKLEDLFVAGLKAHCLLLSKIVRCVVILPQIGELSASLK